MKKNFLFHLVLVVLVLSLAVIGSASDLVIDVPSVTADDLFNNIWDFDLIAESANGESRFYVAVTNDTLYILAEGKLPDPYNNIFFDTDLNAETGYYGYQWTDMGGDFRVTDADFKVSTGRDWKWDQVVEVPYIRFDTEDGLTAFLTAVSLDLFGEIDSLRIGFAGTDVQMPPSGGKSAVVDLF